MTQQLELLSTRITTKPALRYHGSKSQIAKWIISYFAQHECYTETFGGGGSILHQKQRSWLEVYNDLDGEVVNYFKMLRDRPQELIKAIELTPYAKEEYLLSYEESPDPLEMARRFYVRSFMAIAGPTAQWGTGWRRQKVVTKKYGKKKMTPAPLTFMKVDHLYIIANRLRGVQIEHDTALNVIKRYDSPDTLHYVDPPYPAGTRGRWKEKAYKHELTDDDHRELSELLHSLKGTVLISGYDCELYQELYADWSRVAKTTRVNGPGSAVESLWLSPELVRQKGLMLF